MVEKKGLSQEKAEKNLEKYGFNELKDVHSFSALKILYHQVKGNFMFYLLVCAMVLSFIVEKSITAYAILGVIVLVVGIGFFQEYKAEKVIKSLRSMLMPISIVVRDGVEKEIPSKEIVPDDVVVLRSGEKIPADCVVLEQVNLSVDESILTGESKEISKIVFKGGKIKEENLLFMGSFISQGKCVARVVKTGMDTKFGQISKMISSAEKELPLQKKLNHISKFMAIVAILFSIVTGFVLLLGVEISNQVIVDAIILVIALAVSAFPESLPVVLVTALSTGAYRMAKKNAIVNRMSIIETLGETTVICSDKTGTITKGEMTVKKLYGGDSTIDVSGVGYEGNGDFYSEGRKINVLKENVFGLLIKASVICNDARIQRTGEDKLYHVIGSSTEGALLVMASKAGVHSEDLKYERIEEIPFSSERKMMSVFCKHGSDKYVFSKGAGEYIVGKCKYIQKRNNVYRLTEKEREALLKINKKFGKDGLRNLGFAYKKVDSFNKKDFEEDLVFLGFTGMEDSPREEVYDSIRVCLKSGISVKMITGDNKETAVSIAKQIGLSGQVMEGSELDRISEKELAKIVKDIIIFSRVKPEHKLKIVRALKANGEIVTMTGDGVNDAPALKEAHIGVAMGISGTDVSREVSDLILRDDNFSTIVSAVKEGRTIFNNIRKFVSYQLSCNYAELFIIFIGLLLAPFLGWQVPLLLSLQILFMNLVTDDLPAITLAITPSTKDVMLEKPIKDRKILNKSLIYWFVLSGFLMMILSLAVFYVTFNILHQDFDYARTTALVTLILLEIGNAYNFLSFRDGVKIKNLLLNKYLFYASIISIVATLVIIYTPVRSIFGTVHITFMDWVVALIATFVMVLLFNLLKNLNRKKKWFELEKF